LGLGEDPAKEKQLLSLSLTCHSSLLSVHLLTQPRCWTECADPGNDNKALVEGGLPVLGVGLWTARLTLAVALRLVISHKIEQVGSRRPGQLDLRKREIHGKKAGRSSVPWGCPCSPALLFPSWCFPSAEVLLPRAWWRWYFLRACCLVTRGLACTASPGRQGSWLLWLQHSELTRVHPAVR
jgi:hypothetical protein